MFKTLGQVCFRIIINLGLDDALRELAASCILDILLLYVVIHFHLVQVGPSIRLRLHFQHMHLAHLQH
jgi:hypothetical protein